MDRTDPSPADTDHAADDRADRRRRSPVARVRRWFLLTGDRWYVTATILVAIYVGVGPVGHALAPVGTDTFGPDAVRPLLTTLLSGSFLLVSIVVSINSLFVSQEQTPLGRQFDRIRDVGEFRRDIESLVDTPISPAEPARFLRLLTGSILARAQTIDDDLSNGLLLVSIPTTGLVAFVLLHLNSFVDLHTVATLVTTVALTPFALLSAYVVRVGTIARRTRASGQFVVEERSTLGTAPAED